MGLMISVWSFLVVAAAIALVVRVRFREKAERGLGNQWPGGPFQRYGNKKRSS